MMKRSVFGSETIEGVWRASRLRLACASLLLLGTGCISIELFEGGAAKPLEESVLRGEEGPKILLIDIDGVIDGEPWTDSIFGGEALGMVARVSEILDRAREDPEVRALLLRIDTPGGAATASDQIHSEILRFKRDRKVPVLAQLLSTATSGGYYIAMAADAVRAHPTTVTGSIGVVYSSVSFAGLMEKLGIEDQSITSGEHKDMGSPLRRLQPEEREQLQEIVNDLHARFRTIVEQGRPDLPAERIRELADGRIYSASQAVENGLVDGLGTLEDAIRDLESRLGVSRSRVVGYHRAGKPRRNIYSGSQVRGPGMTGSGLADEPFAELSDLARPLVLRKLAQLVSRPGFLYLWWPGIGD
ncbi:MAG: signal peptide peptidase SppA [bacterium]